LNQIFPAVIAGGQLLPRMWYLLYLFFKLWLILVIKGEIPDGDRINFGPFDFFMAVTVCFFAQRESASRS
jgi:hypothetical protein